ncbi:MAG: hypothetical protein WCJ64_27020 [Rhodospirillaceae bacterium]
MSISLVNSGSNVVTAGQSVSLGALFSFTNSGNPAFIVVNGCDRNEYTASWTENYGSVSGNGQTASFSSDYYDYNTLSIAFSWTANGYYSNSFGYLKNLTYTAPTANYQNEYLSIYGASSASALSGYIHNGVYSADLLSDNVRKRPEIIATYYWPVV